MVRIGLISDTHGYLDPLVFTYFKDVDEIWHAGDAGSLKLLDDLKAFKPLRAVYGNIDDATLRREWPRDMRFDIEGLRVVMTHIGGRPGNYAKPALPLILNNPCDLFICGHSHICLVKRDTQHGFLYMNPGAAGQHGFHHMRTLLRFTIDRGKLDSLEVVELGKRGN